MWILGRRERHLRSFPGWRVNGHALDQRLERPEVLSGRCSSKTVIQRVLPECAVRPIDGGKHVVQIQGQPKVLSSSRASASKNGGPAPRGTADMTSMRRVRSIGAPHVARVREQAVACGRDEPPPLTDSSRRTDRTSHRGFIAAVTLPEHSLSAQLGN